MHQTQRLSNSTTAEASNQLQKLTETPAADWLPEELRNRKRGETALLYGIGKFTVLFVAARAMAVFFLKTIPPLLT
jgi:hypothetical protein